MLLKCYVVEEFGFLFSLFFLFLYFSLFLEEAFIYLECYASVKLGGEEAAEEIKLLAPPYHSY
jgi:hypothetical protein